MPPAESLTAIPASGDGSLPSTGSPLDPPRAQEDVPPTAAAAAAICNLLPWTGGSGDGSANTGVYIGEGLPPVPQKLAERIRRWEFIDMAELLPEFWGSTPSTKEPGGKPNPQQIAGRRARRVTDIASWIQCFAVYVGIMAGSSPESVPELMAYLIQIVRVSQDFSGLAWVNYDLAFRRQAAATGNRLWSKINPSLYSICFSGVARANKRCELCLSLTHESGDCALSGEGEHDVGSRLRAIESAVLAMAAGPSSAAVGAANRVAKLEICRSWNENRCTYPKCRFRHVCRVCQGPRPALECCERALGSFRPPRGPAVGRSIAGKWPGAGRPY